MLLRPRTLAYVAAALGATLPLLSPSRAHAYEFEVQATSAGQGYQVRWLRFSERDRWLNRRRFTQTLRLDVWDILAPPFDPADPEAPRRAPVELYVTSMLRLDHDFGEYAAGEVEHLDQGVTLVDPALDLVPELAQDTLQLDVPYAYLGGRELFGWLDFRLGRQLEVDALDWYAFDGLQLVAHTPLHFAIEAHAGALVRSDSLWGSPANDPDGTSDADCRRVESGGDTWIPTDDCAQRRALMPGFGLAIESEGLRHVRARVAYRRAQSRTSDAYPGVAPAWGVNEEKLVVDLRGDLFGGGLQPWAAARWNFVLGLVDEAQAGVRFAWADQGLSPEVVHSSPSFDADSIFNVFASEPYTDLRLVYDVWPGRGRLRAWARGSWRRFANSTDGLAMGETLDASATATGVGAGARLALDRGHARLDLFHEDGHGGLRAGGDLSGRAWLTGEVQLEGRLTLVRFDDDTSSLEGTTFGAQAGVRWLLHEGVALHVIAEENSNRVDRNQFRAIVLLDLAFVPEI